MPPASWESCPHAVACRSAQRAYEVISAPVSNGSPSPLTILEAAEAAAEAADAAADARELSILGSGKGESSLMPRGRISCQLSSLPPAFESVPMKETVYFVLVACISTRTRDRTDTTRNIRRAQYTPAPHWFSQYWFNHTGTTTQRHQPLRCQISHQTVKSCWFSITTVVPIVRGGKLLTRGLCFGCLVP